jgi:hypothetical protein
MFISNYCDYGILIANLQTIIIKFYYMKRLILFISFLSFISLIHAQRIKVLTDSAKISLRGLSVVNDNIIWASGSKGQVARSTDGGKNLNG